MGALLQLPQATRRTQRKDTLRSTQRKAIINKLDVSRETAPYTSVKHNDTYRMQYNLHILRPQTQRAPIEPAHTYNLATSAAVKKSI